MRSRKSKSKDKPSKVLDIHALGSLGQKVQWILKQIEYWRRFNPNIAKKLEDRYRQFVEDLQEKERNILEFAASMEERLRRGLVEDTSPQCMSVKERLCKLYEEYREVFDTVLSIMREIYDMCIEPCEEMWRREDAIIWGNYSPDHVIEKAREATDIARKVIVYGKTCHDWAAMVAALRYRYRGKNIEDLDPVKKLGLIYDYLRFGIDEIAMAKLGTGKVKEALDKLTKLMETYMNICDKEEVAVVLCREYSIRQLWTRFKFPIW